MKKTLFALLTLVLVLPALADDAGGIIPGVLFGPRLAIVNFPAPTVGAEVHIARWVGLSYDYGFIPDIKVGSVKVGWTNWYAGARVFPFHGSFFLGALYGQRSFKASVKDDSSGLEANTKATSSYVAPVLGWNANHRGLGMGLDLGWQLVTRHSRSLTVPSGFDSSKQKDIQDATTKLGTTGLPVLGLLQIQYLF